MAREKISGIYCIRNAINGKCYVGQSVDIYNRWRQHRTALRKNNHYNFDLQNAWNKYSEENFVFEILYECDNSKLDIYEISFIHELNSFWNGYNNDFGGQAGAIYAHCNDDDMRKELKEILHRKVSHRYKPVLQIDFNGCIVNKWDNAHYAAYVIDGNSSEISACLNGKAKTHKRSVWIYKDDYDPESFDISEYIKNVHNVDYDICQYTFSGELIGVYPTAIDAARAVGLHENSIYSCLHKRMLSAAGYIWRYSNEDFDSHRIPTEKRRVCQYDKTGNLIATYETAADAMKQTGISNGIYDSLYGKVELSHGYIWRYEGDKVDVSNVKPSIGKFDLDGILIETYDSVSAALRSINKKNHQPMYECLRGIRDHAHGFIWKYV